MILFPQSNFELISQTWNQSIWFFLLFLFGFVKSLKLAQKFEVKGIYTLQLKWNAILSKYKFCFLFQSSKSMVVRSFDLLKSNWKMFLFFCFSLEVYAPTMMCMLLGGLKHPVSSKLINFSQLEMLSLLYNPFPIWEKMSQNTFWKEYVYIDGLLIWCFESIIIYMIF